MREKTPTARLGKFNGSLKRVVRSYDAHIEVKLRLARALKQKEKNGGAPVSSVSGRFYRNAYSIVPRYFTQKKEVY